MKLYHGTSTDFEEFDVLHAELGIHLAVDPRLADFVLSYQGGSLEDKIEAELAYGDDNVSEDKLIEKAIEDHFESIQGQRVYVCEVDLGNILEVPFNLWDWSNVDQLIEELEVSQLGADHAFLAQTMREALGNLRNSYLPDRPPAVFEQAVIRHVLQNHNVHSIHYPYNGPDLGTRLNCYVVMNPNQIKPYFTQPSSLPKGKGENMNQKKPPYIGWISGGVVEREQLESIGVLVGYESRDGGFEQCVVPDLKKLESLGDAFTWELELIKYVTVDSLIQDAKELHESICAQMRESGWEGELPGFSQSQYLCKTTVLGQKARIALAADQASPAVISLFGLIEAAALREEIADLAPEEEWRARDRASRIILVHQNPIKDLVQLKINFEHLIQQAEEAEDTPGPRL